MTCLLPVLILPKLNGPQRFYARHRPWLRVRRVTWRDTCDEHGSTVLIVPSDQAEQLSVQYHRNTDQECVILTISWALWRAVPYGIQTVSAPQLVRPRQVCPQGTWSRLLRIRPRNSSWAALWLVPSRRQVAVAPQWRVQWLLTRLHGDTALALSASAQGVPAPAALLVLKTLTEATAPCMLASFAPSRGHGPLGCPGRQPERPLCLAGLSCCCSLPQA